MAEMRCRIVWTDEAIKTKNNIYQYFQNNWSEKEIESFFTRLDGQLALLSIFPKMGKPSDKKAGYRETVLSAYQTIYYKEIFEIPPRPAAGFVPICREVNF